MLLAFGICDSMPKPIIDELNEVNKDAIESYMNITRQRLSKKTTLNNHYHYVTRMLRKINKDYNDITSDDLLTYLNKFKPSSSETMKPAIISFFKHHNMISLGESIPRNPRALSQITKGDECVLSGEEIEKIINAPNKLMYRALLETFVITGARRNEILSLDIGDVKVDPDVVWINIRESKTKIRKIPVIPNSDNPVARFPTYLIQWLKFREGAKPNEPLFQTIRGRRLNNYSMYDVVNWLNNKCGLDKHITPHILRHTGATYDGQYLTESMLCQKYGWVVGSDMARRYVHANAKQLAHMMMKNAGLKESEVKKGRSCPRCGEINNINSEVCSKCQQILDPKKLIEQVQKQDKERVDLRTEIETLKESQASIMRLVKSVFYKSMVETSDTEPDIEQLSTEYDELLRESNKPGRRKVKPSK